MTLENNPESLTCVIVWCRGSLMYVQAVGWELARKDKIDLEAGNLREKAGLYTCPPTLAGQKPFHCTLNIKEEPINVRALMTVECPTSSAAHHDAHPMLPSPKRPTQC